MRLFTIGESVTQGFMSGAAAETRLSFSTLLAEAMGLTVGGDYTSRGGPSAGIR